MAERQIDGLSSRQLVWAMAVGQAVLVTHLHRRQHHPPGIQPPG
ncbi:hypothetical protein QP028_07280 [Corynebacterium suedekumii]|nr:hypothetical protein QP028_07280 [Corynebacterium suedekumii]